MIDNNYNLFLDDERNPNISMNYTGNDIYWIKKWTTVKNYNEFIDYIKTKGIPEIISFDHDLASEHYKYACATHIPYNELKIKTGYHCLIWLLTYCTRKNLELPEILIHTMNVTGADTMQNMIDAYREINNDL